MRYSRAEDEEDLGVGEGRVGEVLLLAPAGSTPATRGGLARAGVTRGVLAARVVPG